MAKRVSGVGCGKEKEDPGEEIGKGSGTGGKVGRVGREDNQGEREGRKNGN